MHLRFTQVSFGVEASPHFEQQGPEFEDTERARRTLTLTLSCKREEIMGSFYNPKKKALSYSSLLSFQYTRGNLMLSLLSEGMPNLRKIFVHT